VEIASRRLLLSTPYLGTAQPEQVTDRVAALQTGAQHGITRLEEHMGNRVGSDGIGRT
jgi:hypothetical protein